MVETKTVTKFLSSLEGYHSLCKMIHWSTTNKAEHLLADEIDHEVLSFEDRFAEAAMGLLSLRFGVGDLQTLLPENKTLPLMLEEMQADVDRLRSECENDERTAVCGLGNILDDFLEKILSWKYLATLK